MNDWKIGDICYFLTDGGKDTPPNVFRGKVIDVYWDISSDFNVIEAEHPITFERRTVIDDGWLVCHSSDDLLEHIAHEYDIVKTFIATEEED